MRRTQGWTLALALSAGLLLPSAAWAGELARARGLMESGQYQDAIPILEKFTKTFPNEPRGWALLADCYQNVFPPMVNEAGTALARKDNAQNKRQAALSTFSSLEGTGVYQRLVADEPQDLQNNLLLGIALITNDHDPDAAKKQLDRTTKLGVTSDLRDAFYNAWGLYYIEVKEWENARKMFTVAKRTSTFALGKLQEVEKLESAQRKEQEAAENDPARIAERRFNQLMTEARTMVREGRHEAAVDLIEDALRLKDGDSEAQTMLAESKLAASSDLYWQGKKLVDASQHAEAYSKFDRALQLDPTNASASLGLEHVKKKLDDDNKPQVIRRFIPATGSAPVNP
jgi:tetratricopeptide (TPR) repeat protein